jgi:single-stranded DNA-binding protein
VNSVSLIGELTEEPVLRRNRAGVHECRMRMAIPRYSRGGRREPGVVYVDVTTFGLDAVDHAERLSRGSRIGLSGRLESDEPEWSGVVIDQLDVL